MISMAKTILSSTFGTDPANAGSFSSVVKVKNYSGQNHLAAEIQKYFAVDVTYRAVVGQPEQLVHDRTHGGREHSSAPGGERHKSDRSAVKAFHACISK